MPQEIEKSPLALHGGEKSIQHPLPPMFPGGLKIGSEEEAAVLDVIRNQRESTSREVFDAAAKVELAKIDRRNAELEIQRMYEMVAQKVTDTSLAKPPLPPAK